MFPLDKNIFEFPLSEDPDVVQRFMPVYLCLGVRSSVFSTHKMQLVLSTGDVNAELSL